MAKMDSFKAWLKPKEKKSGKVDTLEKNDFKALNIAAFQIFGPVLLILLVLFALVIFLILKVWN